MSKKDEYKLNFSKLKTPNGFTFRCSRWGNLNASYYLGDLLSGMSVLESGCLLEEIDNAIDGKYFEEYYSLDNSRLSLQLIPPNALIENELSIPLSELRELLVEWITFCKS